MGNEATEKVTEEQAIAAMRALTTGEPMEQPEPVPATTEAKPEPSPTEPIETVETEPAQATEVDASGIAVAPSDDVESLKKRLAEVEDGKTRAERRAEQQVEAIQRRFAQNEQIIRDKYLRKSSIADRALRTLEKTRTQEGVPESEVDRVIQEIRSSMNPESPSYVQPAAQQPVSQEDQAIILNAFLNEKAMTNDESEEFGGWLRTKASAQMSPFEQQVAGRDLDGFLRLAHRRFLEDAREVDKQKTRDDAVQAVKAVQQTQRAAARAASAAPAAPRKLPASQPQEVDTSKLTKDDISKLVRASFEQYR